MKKKILPIIWAVCLMAGILAGCSQKEAVAEGEEVVTDTVTDEVVENDTGSESDSEVVSPQECSLCQVEKECGSYEVGGQTYVVCDDCYGEFATAFDLKEPCGHCEEEKICGYYTVDGEKYVVCDDCYDEFAEGFGLK